MMNGPVEVVCGPTGPALGPEYVWDEYNQLYRISDGRLVKQNDPYYDYSMYLMQQGFEYNPAAGGYTPILQGAIPFIPGPPRDAAPQVKGRGKARKTNTKTNQRQTSDSGVANNQVTPGTVGNSNVTTEPIVGTARASGPTVESGMTGGAEREDINRNASARVNCSTTSEKSGTARDSSEVTVSNKSEVGEMLVNGKKLVRVETALDFLNKASEADLGGGNSGSTPATVVVTTSLAELSHALRTSSRRAELDKVIPRFPMNGMDTATVRSLKKRLSRISGGDARNARPELFVLREETTQQRRGGRGKKGGSRVRTGVGGDTDHPGHGYFLFRLHSSNDEDDDESSPTTTTTTTSTTTTSTTYDSATSSSDSSSSTSSSSSSSSSSSDSSGDYSDEDDEKKRHKKKKAKKKKKKRRMKYYDPTTEYSSEYDDDYDDYDDTYDYDYDYDYDDYTGYDYDDTYDYDYDYEDYSESSSARRLPRPRKEHIVHSSSSSETSVGGRGHRRPTHPRRVKRQPKVKRLKEAAAVPVVQPTTQLAPPPPGPPLPVGSENNLGNVNANNYLTSKGVRVSSREVSSSAGYVDSQEDGVAGQTPDDAFVSCVEEAETAAAAQRREEWSSQRGRQGNEADTAHEQRREDAQRHYGRTRTDNDPHDDREMTHHSVHTPHDRRMIRVQVYDHHHDGRRMAHDQVYDHHDNRRMSHDQVYDHQDDRWMSHDQDCNPHDDGRMSYNPVYDPQHEIVYETQDGRNSAYYPQDNRGMTHQQFYDPQHDKRMTHDQAYDPQDGRRMSHNPDYDPRENRRIITHDPVYYCQDNRVMTHDPTYEAHDDGRNITHDPNYNPHDDRGGMTHSENYDYSQDDRRTMAQAPVYDSGEWQWQRHAPETTESDPRHRGGETHEMQRNQNANGGRTNFIYEDESAAAAAAEKEEDALRMAAEDEEEESLRMEAAAAGHRVMASKSRSVASVNASRSTEFVEIMAKAIAFPDGKYEIVDVDVVPLKSRRPGPSPRLKVNSARTTRIKRPLRRAPSCRRIPLTSSRAEIADTQQQYHHQPSTSSSYQLHLAQSQTTNDVDANRVSDVHPLSAPADVSARRVDDVTLQTTINDLIANRINDYNFQTTISDVIVNKVNDVLQRTSIDDVIVSKVSDAVLQRTTSAKQTDKTATTSLVAAEPRKVRAPAHLFESTSPTETGMTLRRRNSSTQTTVTKTDDCLRHQQKLNNAAASSSSSVPCRSPLYHRHHLNQSSSNCTSPPCPPPPPPSSSAALPVTPSHLTQQNLLTDKPSATVQSSSSSHLVKYGNFVYSLYQQDQLTDVILKAGAECFYAHRSVLACHSRYFASVFTQEPIPSSSSTSGGLLSSPPTPDILEIDDVSPSILRKILEYIYTGQIALHQSYLLDVLVAANKLGLPQLESNCVQKLSGLHPHQLLDVMISAYNKHGMTAAASDLIDKLWHRIACHFKTVVRTKQFLQMNVDCVCRLLTDNDLVLTSEIDVAHAAIRWINDDREKRVPIAGSVLSCIRFKNLTPDELVALGRRESYILNDPTVKDAILEANWYQTCQLGRTDSGMTSFKSPHIRQKTDLRTQEYKAELPIHPSIIPYENWRN